METLIDYYDIGNTDSAGALDITGAALGQSFTGKPFILLSALFAIKKFGSPSGPVYIKVYAHSGTYGTSSVPTGSPIATSDAVEASGLSDTAYVNELFTFSGVNMIPLKNGERYCLVITFDGTASDRVGVAFDNSSPTHSGNKFYYFNGWNAQGTMDMIFYVFGDVITGPFPTSRLDLL